MSLLLFDVFMGKTVREMGRHWDEPCLNTVKVTTNALCG